MPRQITKCAYRVLIEDKLDDIDEDNKCYKCYGFNRQCGNYATMESVMNTYEERLNRKLDERISKLEEINNGK